MKDTGSDKRRSERVPVTQDVSFSVAGFVGRGRFFTPEMRGTVVDVSKGGMGMLTETPLRTGNLLRFDHIEAPHLGIVIWSWPAGTYFRVGVRLV